MAVSLVAKNTPVVGVVTGIWSEAVRNTVFDDSVTGGDSEDSLMKIDPTVIVGLLLISLAFVTEIFVLIEDPVVNVGLMLPWVVVSENTIIEAGVGEIMGVEN
jgi:hypothetical protein